MAKQQRPERRFRMLSSASPILCFIHHQIFILKKIQKTPVPDILICPKRSLSEEPLRLLFLFLIFFLIIFSYVKL